MGSGGFGVRALLGQRRVRGVVVSHPVCEPSQRAAAQALRVIPAFTEYGLHVADGRSLDGKLHVVPRRSWPVHRRHRLWLGVSRMRCVVAAPVAQVGAPEEGDVQLGPRPVAQDDELLVVRSAGPHPHVEQALTAGVVDLVAQPPVFRRGERQTVPVGAPDEPAYVDPAPGRVREHLPDLRVRGTGEALVRVAAPVDEHQQVTIAHLRHPDGAARRSTSLHG